MKRWIGMAFIILALAGCDGGNGSRGETTAGLASLGPGSTWTYALTFVEAGATFTSRVHVRIADRRTWRGRDVVVVLSEDGTEAPPSAGEPWALTTYLDARTGNTVADFDGETLQTEYVPDDGLLSLPLEVGKTWTATYTETDYDGVEEELGSETVSAAHEVLAFEDVSTPAGSFRAYRIERIESSSGGTDTTTTLLLCARPRIDREVDGRRGRGRCGRARSEVRAKARVVAAVSTSLDGAPLGQGGRRDGREAAGRFQAAAAVPAWDCCGRCAAGCRLTAPCAWQYRGFF